MGEAGSLQPNPQHPGMEEEQRTAERPGLVPHSAGAGVLGFWETTRVFSSLAKREQFLLFPSMCCNAGDLLFVLQWLQKSFPQHHPQSFTLQVPFGEEGPHKRNDGGGGGQELKRLSVILHEFSEESLHRHILGCVCGGCRVRAR